LNRPIGFLASLAEGLEERLATLATAKNVLPVAAAAHHMVNRAGVLDA
jgi:hypothetical protein